MYNISRTTVLNSIITVIVPPADWLHIPLTYIKAHTVFLLQYGYGIWQRMQFKGWSR